MSKVIWENKLDDKYDIIVSRPSSRSVDSDAPISAEDLYKGTLTITEGQKVLFTKDVTISYGAIFGPDIADVESWQNIAIEFIDGQSS